jgi:hypothetical protein
MTLSAFGLEIDLPDGWDGWIYRSEGGGNGTIGQIGNFPLPRYVRDDTGTLTQQGMQSGQIFLTLFEWWKDPPYIPGNNFLPLAGKPAVRSEDFGPWGSMKPAKRPIVYASRTFQTNGRYFQLGAAFFREVPATILDEANAVLATLQVATGDFRPSYEARHIHSNTGSA